MSLTVIIPAYNEEKYIAKTIQSISGAEIIVVCNGCTDNTATIAKNNGAIVIETNKKGVSLARNLGAQNSTNSRLIFLDADTLVTSSILEKILNSKFQVGATWVKPDSNLIRDKFFMAIKSVINTLFSRSSGLIFTDKNIYERVGGFNENISKREDTYFMHAAKKHANFGIIADYVCTSMRRYRQQGYITMFLFWTREAFFPSKEEYKSIR
jgi:glycosyltransferase involved in cell wall biosynthesis